MEKPKRERVRARPEDEASSSSMIKAVREEVMRVKQRIMLSEL